MNLLDSFQRYIDENDLATHDDRILLTVSGGENIEKVLLKG